MSDSLDDEFNAFLQEVDALSIHHNNATGADGDYVNDNQLQPNIQQVSSDSFNNEQNSEEPAIVPCENDALTVCTVTDKEEKKLIRKQKENIIKKAGVNQRAWAEFTKLDLSKTESSDSVDNSGGPKISFKIQSDKSKSKKKNRCASQPSSGISDKPTQRDKRTDTDTTTTTIESDSSYITLHLCPCWTLVIDTSAFINDNGFEAQKLIDLANHVSLTRFKHQRQHDNKREYSSKNAIVEEPIQIIIPYKVWNELEYQSKSDDSDLAFSARTVIRMLKDELKQNSVHTAADINGPDKVVKAQTLVQSQDASKRFVLHEFSSKPTNDDHILACALVEQEKWAPNSVASVTSGGVVLITSDNNMACKAHSNGLKVYSASEFCDYYVERMNSLRQRTLT